MALPQPDLRITLANMAADVPILTPHEAQMRTLDRRDKAAVTRGRELDLATAEDQRQQTEVVRRVALESEGDWERMIPRLRAVAPAIAMKFEEDLLKQRGERAKAAKAELEQEALDTEWGLGLLRSARDPETYRVIRQQVVQRLPDMDPILPPEFDPGIVAQVQTRGEQAKDFIGRQYKSLELLADGKWNVAAGMALSAAPDEQEWNATLAGLKTMGVPAAVLAQFGAWSPDAPMRAEQLAMTPDVRADNARGDAAEARAYEQFEETGRHNRAMEGVAQQNAGSNAVRASRTGKSGGSGGGAAKGGGSDEVVSAFADAYMAGHPEVLQGKTPTLSGQVEGEVLRRGGTLVQRRVKLPAAMTQKVMDAEQGLNTLDRLDGLSKTVGTGPVAGRILSYSKGMPGVSVSKDAAEFLAETSKLTNRTITAITGAAMGEAEAQRIMAELPQVTDKASVWQANAASTRRNLEYLARRALELNGATPEMVEEYAAERKPKPKAATAPAAPKAGGGGVDVVLPDGRVKRFPSAAAADGFKKAAGIR